MYFVQRISAKKKEVQKLNDSNYKSGLNLSKAITKIMKPIIQDLSENELLEKFLHGQIQNSNEAFRQLICRKCYPKTIATSKISETAISSDIINHS